MKVKVQMWIGEQTFYKERDQDPGQTIWHTLIRILYDIHARYQEREHGNEDE